MAKDKCVICTKETVYDFQTHIDLRIGYVEGVGQLCYECYKNDNSVHSNQDSKLCIPSNLVLENPNDFELGGKVRQMHYDTKNHS